EIIAGRAESSLAYEDEHVIAFMDIRPLTQGHVLVVPRVHADYLEALDEELGARLFRAGHRLARALRRSGLPCEGVNLFLATGRPSSRRYSTCIYMSCHGLLVTGSASKPRGAALAAPNWTRPPGRSVRACARWPAENHAYRPRLHTQRRERSLAGIRSGSGSRESFWPGRIVDMTVAYLVQHGEKESLPGDPGLTAIGRQQATRTGRWLRGQGIHALCTSPLQRARETAECIASVTGLTAQPDARLRERRNWDGSMPVEAFLALWARTRHDRDFAPGNEESSRQAGTRLQAFLAGLPGTPGPVAA